MNAVTALTTLTINGIEPVMTSTGKQKFNVQTDKGIYTVWDAELSAELGRNLGKTYECKTSLKNAPNGFTYRNILDAFLVQGVAVGSPLQSPPTSGPTARPDASIEIRSQVALKAAVELICAGKSESTVKALTVELYTLLKEIAEVEKR